MGDAVLPVSLGDAEIIGHSRTHPELFRALFERHSGTLFRYACRRVGAEVAEDVVGRRCVVGPADMLKPVAGFAVRSLGRVQ